MSITDSTNKDFNKVLERLQRLSGFLKENEIAELLGFKHVAFSARKVRGSVPVKEIRLTAVSRGWNPGWILTGEGEMYLTPAPTDPNRHKLDELWVKLTEKERKAIIALIKGLTVSDPIKNGE